MSLRDLAVKAIVAVGGACNDVKSLYASKESQEEFKASAKKLAKDLGNIATETGNNIKNEFDSIVSEAKEQLKEKEEQKKAEQKQSENNNKSVEEIRVEVMKEKAKEDVYTYDFVPEEDDIELEVQKRLKEKVDIDKKEKAEE